MKLLFSELLVMRCILEISSENHLDLLSFRHVVIFIFRQYGSMNVLSGLVFWVSKIKLRILHNVWVIWFVFFISSFVCVCSLKWFQFTLWNSAQSNQMWNRVRFQHLHYKRHLTPSAFCTVCWVTHDFTNHYHWSL